MPRKRHRLAERRKVVGLSQERLAEAVGVDRSTVVRWEGAETDPQPWHRPRLARALGVSVEDLAVLLADMDGETSIRQHLADHLSAGLRGEALTLGDDHLAVVASLRKSDRQIGGHYLYATVTGYLHRKIAPRLFGDLPDRDGTSAYVAAAGLTEMAGWMAHDAGRDSLAERHFKRALPLARVGQDRHLVGHIYGSLSHLAIHSRRPQSGLDYAKLGCAALNAGPRHDGMKARLYAMQARGHAANRDGDLCLEVLRRAERALAQPPSDSASPWVSTFDEASLAVETARCLHELGQPGPARREAEKAVGLRPRERTRSRAHAQLMLVSSLVAQGNPDQACRVAEEVLDATSGLGSYLVAQQLQRLTFALKPYRQNRDVVAFLEKLTNELRDRRWLARWASPITSGVAGSGPM